MFTIPMCFKGECGDKNRKMFKQHHLPEPDNEESNRIAKIYGIIQIEEFYNSCGKSVNVGCCIERI